MKTLFPAILGLLGASCAFAQDAAPSIVATAKGVEIQSAAGTFVLAPAALRLSEDDYNAKKPDLDLEGDDTVVATFASGAQLKMQVSAEQRTVWCVFSEMPDGAWGLLLQMEIPIAFASGGKFSFAGKPPQTFPAEKGSQLIAQESTKQFNLANPSGAGFSIVSTPGYTQVQDNRVFNWPVFMYIYNFVFSAHPGAKSFELRFDALDPALSPQ